MKDIMTGLGIGVVLLVLVAVLAAVTQEESDKKYSGRTPNSFSGFVANP